MERDNNVIFLILGIGLLCLGLSTLMSIKDVSSLKTQVEQLEKQNTELKDTISQNLSRPININISINKAIEEEDIEFYEEPANIYYDDISNLTDYEKDLIYRITFREAGNQCEEGQRAVMEVILNRLQSDVWPDTIEGVLSQPGQFSTWRLRHKVSQENIEEMEEILELVATEEPVLSNDYVFFNSLTNPKMKNRVKIEGHWFGTR